jgi:hypothetical protein
MTVKVSIPQTKYTNARAAAGVLQSAVRADRRAARRGRRGRHELPAARTASAPRPASRSSASRKPPAGQEPSPTSASITHNYFKAMGVPLLRGRAFDSRDTGTGVGA